MFSLDDDTLEAGGESILASEGDLGELLFSASAGLANLSHRLGDLRTEADGFYKKRARSGELGELKSQLEALKDERTKIDTLASRYAQLVGARDGAESRYEETIAARGRIQSRMDEIQRLLAALIDQHQRQPKPVVNEHRRLPEPGRVGKYEHRNGNRAEQIGRAYCYCLPGRALSACKQGTRDANVEIKTLSAGDRKAQS